MFCNCHMDVSPYVDDIYSKTMGWQEHRVPPCPKETGLNLKLMPCSQSCRTKRLSTCVPGCYLQCHPWKFNSTVCLCDDTFPLYSEKNTNVNLSTLKKRKAEMLSPLDSKRQALHLWKTPSKGQRMNYFVWPSRSKLKRKKSFGVCEFWCSSKDVKLEGPGCSRLLFSQKTKTLPVPELCQKRPSFWEAIEEALHQASKTAHKALPRGKVLSVLALPTGNKWPLSHLMGNERWLAADCIWPWCKGQYV